MGAVSVFLGAALIGTAGILGVNGADLLGSVTVMYGGLILSSAGIISLA